MRQTPPILGTLESVLYAEDLDAAEAFWTGIFGLSVYSRQEGRDLFFRLAAGPQPQMLLIFNPAATAVRAPGQRVPTHGATGPGHFCLAVPDDSLDAWRAHLEAAGVEIEADLAWPNGGRSIYVRDPAGNSIELADPAIWR